MIAYDSLIFYMKVCFDLSRNFIFHTKKGPHKQIIKVLYSVSTKFPKTRLLLQSFQNLFPLCSGSWKFILLYKICSVNYLVYDKHINKYGAALLRRTIDAFQREMFVRTYILLHMMKFEGLNTLRVCLMLVFTNVVYNAPLHRWYTYQK